MLAVSLKRAETMFDGKGVGGIPRISFTIEVSTRRAGVGNWLWGTPSNLDVQGCSGQNKPKFKALQVCAELVVPYACCEDPH